MGCSSTHTTHWHTHIVSQLCVDIILPIQGNEFDGLRGTNELMENCSISASLGCYRNRQCVYMYTIISNGDERF